jgi:hypothetical protein
MITNNVKTVTKGSLFLSALIACFFSFSQANAATNSTAKFGNEEIHADSTKANKLEVKYLGNNSNVYEFDVRYANVKGGTFSFIIKDETGEILFEKEYASKGFRKKVQLPQIDDINKLTFIISSQKDNLLLSKNVVIKTRFVEDVLVKIN